MFISNNYNKLSKSQTFFSNLNNFKQGLPELDLETIEENRKFSPKSYLSQSFYKKTSIQSIRNTLIYSKKNLTVKDFIFLIFFIILSSLQLGIFIYGIDLLIKEFPSLNNNFIIFVSMLFWKWEIYLICFLLIYFIFKYFLGENDEIINDYYPINQDNENEDFNNYLTYFAKSSSLKQSISKSFSLKNILNDLLGVYSSFLIYYSSNYLSFGLVILMTSLTQLIPFYIDITKGSNYPSNEYSFSKIISPVFILSGIISLRFSLNSFFNISIFLFSLFSLILCQIINQKYYFIILKDESPFNLLFSKYLNYFIFTGLLFMFYSLIAFNFQYFYFIGWLMSWKVCLFVFIGFGIFGFSFIFFTLMSSFIFKRKLAFKNIKYFEVVLNDLFYFFIFRKINILFNFSYIFGIVECLLAILLIDYHNEITNYFKPRKKVKIS